ncbi:MAG: GTP-binding protein [Candidatus Helarchaeota archaeon]
MVRIKNWELMNRLMFDVKSIKNIGIIAHIDHGKTTLSDILLSKSGIISKSVAGDARVLDYLDEEQKRGITIKSANISLLYNNYIINLIDTPGHVDFSGKVTRALRIIDGVIVVIDAVEGVMVQTEILTKQALSELVKPILFINKIDRLVNELKLSEDKIRKRLDYIIQMFNKILMNSLPEDFYERWKIVPNRNNVVFGSALHHWGFIYKQMISSGKKFGTIMEVYKKSDNIHDYREICYNIFPLDTAIFEAVIENIPDPKTAQKYRIPKIWKGDINSKLGQDLINCNKNGITLVEINKIISDPHAGRIAIGRIFSGSLKIGDKLFLINKNEDFRLLNLYLFMGASKHVVKELPAGNIIGITGNKEIPIGETLISYKYKDFATPFEEIKYTQDPVVTVSIEAYHPRELKKMLEILKKIDQEDPNLEVQINEETGEYLISGMGELHLEIVTKMIEDQGVKVITTKPMVKFAETIGKKSEPILFTSNDNMFSIKYSIEPLDPTTISLLQKGMITNSIDHDELVLKLLELNNENWTKSEAELIISIIEKANIILDESKKFVKHSKRYFDDKLVFIINLFKQVLKHGPILGEKILGLKIRINDFFVDDSIIGLGPIMVLEEFKRNFYAEFNKCRPELLEPIYKIQITTPIDYMGKCTAIIEGKRGEIEHISTEDSYAIITGYIPVKESFNLADEMRSKTSGWAFWQTVFSHWSKVPENKMQEYINDKKSLYFNHNL